jgi:GntR family histidine utilization transcriptional repressor
VPSENELIAELGVSKMTANRALRELANEGELVRVRGVGSFVANRKTHSAALEVRNIADEIAERGHVHQAVVIVLSEEAASPDVADALYLAIGSPVFHSLIVHSENGVPMQIEDRFVDPQSAPDYLSQDFVSLTPNAYLSSVAPMSGSEHMVEAIMPQPWECKLLTMMRTEPCLAIRRRTWAAGRVVSLARLVYPGNRYRLTASSGLGPEK